ncbi:MAG: cyclodeaminase/cyclohydrolase family protein [Firmicutes bacterium]|nr:cyclodeaminase/cyclohydrolase family protein [Bacillota bacterium]
MENKSLKEFTELLASKSPVPGGGGACAAVSAIGIALGDMVGEFTVGKKKYAAVEDELRRNMEKAQQLRESLLECIQADADSFEPLSKAYGIPKDDPERDKIMEKCLRDAAEVPLRIFRLTMESVKLLGEFAGKGSPLMVSDAATGVAFCKAALMGAAVNIKVNTRLMKDREYAEDLDRYVNNNLNLYTELCDRIFNSVVSRF